MKFDIHAYDQIIYHWMLQGKDTLIDKISHTPEWVEEKKFVAKVTVNGVELAAEALEEWLKEVYKRTVDKAREEFADLDAEVQRRLEKRLVTEAQPIIDKLNNLTQALDDIGSAVKPYWEK